MPELIETYAPTVIDHVLEVMAGLMMALGAQSVIETLVPAEHEALGQDLLRGFEGNVVVEMAVVAREYGKPCVGGISQLLERLEDGQWVEVDGTAGVVRILG